VSLSTHDASGITELDLQLARLIEKQAAGRSLG
jgi:pterin-4a-carbinolamine dehydratase